MKSFHFCINQYFIMKSVLLSYDVINKIRNLKQNNEFIRKYYERINNSFIVEFDYKNKTKNVTFFEKKLIWLTFVIEKWIRKIKNTKLFDYFANKFVKNLFDAYIIAKRKMLKKKRKFRQKKKRKFQKKYQMILQQFQNFVDRDLVDRDVIRIQKFHEFFSILKQIRFEVSKICIAVNITNILLFAKFIVSEFTSSQRSSFEINIIYEFSFILKKTSCNLLKISADIVNDDNIELIDEIFAFESGKWIVVVAKKKIFDSINTFANFWKNSFESHIEKNVEIVKVLNKTCVESIVDVKILNQKIFALIVMYNSFSKNSFALFFENLKISIAMNMSFFKHFMNMNDSVIEIFDFDIALNAISKNSSIQQFENLKTTKKISDSICIYEFFAFFVFDFNIDIDFQIYTIDIETFSFDWNRCCNNSIDFSIFSISICIFVSTVIFITSNVTFEITTIDFYEKEQSLSFCFVDIFVSISVDVISTDENTNFYEKKQSFCFRNYVIFIVVIENIDALILIADLINTTNNSVWMSRLSSVVNLISKSKYKKLSKMKIKQS